MIKLNSHDWPWEIKFNSILVSWFKINKIGLVLMDIKQTNLSIPPLHVSTFHWLWSFWQDSISLRTSWRKEPCAFSTCCRGQAATCPSLTAASHGSLTQLLPRSSPRLLLPLGCLARLLATSCDCLLQPMPLGTAAYHPFSSGAHYATVLTAAAANTPLALLLDCHDRTATNANLVLTCCHIPLPLTDW